MSYQTGQIESFTVWYFYDLLDCKIPNRLGKFFYLLTLDGSTICNQLRLGDDYKHELYTIKVLANVWFTRFLV